METEWIFACNGILLQAGPKKLAKNGMLGVSKENELVLFNDNGDVIDRAPVSQAVVKFSAFLGDSIKMNGHKYALSFVPPPKTSAMLLGGAVGALASGMAQGMENADQSKKREELKALMESLA